MTCKEIRVKIKTEDRKYQQDFLEYNDFVVSYSDPTIEKCIRELKSSIQGELKDPDIEIIIKMQIE